jgi:hypothetical protein
MSKCVLGRELYRHLEESSRVVSIWEMRRVVPDFAPDVDVSREDAEARQIASQRAFLLHSNDCEKCRNLDEHRLMDGSGELALVGSTAGGVIPINRKR